MINVHERFNLNDLKWWGCIAVMGFTSIGIANAMTGGAVAEQAVEVKDNVVEAVVNAPSAISDTIAKLKAAVIGQESGGDHQVVNPDSGAIGLGQVMPENVGPWSEQCLNRTISPEEFREDPDAQTQIISCKLQEYWDAAIARGESQYDACRSVAATWYSGDPSLKDSTTPQSGYPSIKDYTESVCSDFAGLMYRIK